MKIEGQVAAGFEPVKALFERNMNSLVERNAQLSIYVGEERVVDLWASAIDDTQFTADSLVNVFSSGKSLEAITMAMLYDRGVLDYNARIADYWPEYASHGKEGTRIADLMRHEAGLAAFDTTINPVDLHTANLQANTVGALIERQSAQFREGAGNQREYHAITRGWIANEVFRRVEPQGRTMGQFLRDEVSSVFDIDVHIGLQDAELERMSDVVMLGFGYQFVQGLVPRRLGRKTELNLAQTSAKLWRLLKGRKSGTTTGAPTPLTGLQKLSVINTAQVAKAEIPSAGARCSARGLSKLAAVMANGGRFGDQQLLSEAAYTALHAEPVVRDMMSMETTFTQGGVATFSTPEPGGAAGRVGPMTAGLNEGREGFYGWMGLGGSIFQWHPEHKIGFGYVPTSLNILDIVNERGKAYQAEVVKCLG